MKRAILTLVLAIGVCCCAFSLVRSAPLKVEGDTILIVKTLPCNVIAPEGADLYQWSYPDSLKVTIQDNVLTISNAPKGTHRVSVLMITLVVDFDKKSKKVTKESSSVEVNIGDIPKPAPDPLPPKDPLVKALKLAYDSETSGDKEKHMKALAAVYEEAGKMTNDEWKPIKTVAQLYSVLITVSRKMLPIEALPLVRKVIGDELRKIFPSTDADITTETRDKAKSLFTNLGSAMLEAMK